MTHTEYMELRGKIVDAMWEKNVLPERRADNIMEICGIVYEEPEQKEINE
jgi:hypothetical protein